MKFTEVRPLLTGLAFSMLWASASVAGKFGIFSAEPLVLFNIRFVVAGLLLLGFVYGWQRDRLPLGREWFQLTIFGAFNTTLYLGLFVVALQYMTPGITSLAIALNPLFISLMTSIWQKRPVSLREGASLVLGLGGVGLAAWPLLNTSYASPAGLLLLALSMLTYSFGSVYYAAISWQLPRTTINAWQVLFGGILLLPFTWALHERANTFDGRFWLSLAWLVLPVSIGAVQLWLRLLKADAVRASLWLYLCPIFGFIYATVLLHEPFTPYTVAGTGLVLLALYIGQQRR